MSELRCPSCNNVQNSSFRYCPVCGKDLADTKGQIKTDQIYQQKPTEKEQNLQGLDYYNQIAKNVKQRRRDRISREFGVLTKEDRIQNREIWKQKKGLRIFVYVMIVFSTVVVGFCIYALYYWAKSNQ